MMSETGLIGRWSPGIGDPTLAGWLTVLLYLIAAWQCHRLIRSEHTLRLRLGIDEKRVWWAVAVGLALLGVNKQLDLQTALTEFARLLARQQGWYETRRAAQLWFLAAIGTLGLVASSSVALIAARMPTGTRIALAGCIALLAFVLIRAASFHHVDVLIRHPVLGLRINWILEIGGIAVVLLGARLRARS
ncbi:MAG: hypothetical protein HGA75_12190 [Thiobacillus sp.]|nr:hypothetical protein [Thiobacillus sp.]